MNERIASNFRACFREVADVPNLWQRNHDDLMRFVGVVEVKIVAHGLCQFEVLPKFETAARIIIAMYHLSSGPEGRVAAVNALWALQAFVEVNVSREASAALVEDKQMVLIRERYQNDHELVSTSSEPTIKQGRSRRKSSGSSATA